MVEALENAGQGGEENRPYLFQAPERTLVELDVSEATALVAAIN